VIAALVAPGLIAALAASVAPALALGVGAIVWHWRRLGEGGELVLPATSNPTELRTAVGFGALYAVVLLCAAWLSDRVGNSGLYVLALVSGLTDVDAITLSTLRLFSLDKLAMEPAVMAVVLGMVANLGFKIAMAFAIGGPGLGWRAVPGMAAVAAGLGLGVAWRMLV
ncbi:MAG: DUF4010 domain-containing protein, partial [Proteobacteria bacterium]|nr:DUF4010 domain-containing protein [Pseudomonadota bacterium]